MEYKDYYQVLGVPKTATQDQIKKAYRKKARELHPDRNPGDAEAERRFKEANEAHAVLSDAEKRKRYDELGANWQAYEQAGYGGGATDWAGFGGAPGGTRWEYRRVSPEDLGGFSEFFQSFFGGAGAGPMGAGSTSRPGSGGHEQVFEFSDFGGADFGGATFETGDFGTGRTRRSVGLPPPSATAVAEVTLDEVARGAERMVDVDGRRLQVKIPAGVTDGAKIKLRGGGMRGGDGASGDLVITVRVTPDPRFERRGADLTTELPLTLAEALLGAEVPVPDADRLGQAPHPAEHPERAGDPRPRPRVAETRRCEGRQGRPDRPRAGRPATAGRGGGRGAAPGAGQVPPAGPS